MKRRPSEIPVPPDARQPIRKAIAAAIEGKTLSARDISAEAGIPEKDVCPHLLHIRKSGRREGFRLHVTPAACNGCGFVFRKRDRLAKPGKCPVCRGTSISPPLFGIEPGSTS